MHCGRSLPKCHRVCRYEDLGSTKPDRSGHRDAAGNSNGEKAQRQPQWRGKGGKNNGQSGNGQGQHHPVADEAAKGQAGKGKGKPNGKTGGKPGGKASGKAGKRKREGKGDAETTPSKKKRDDMTCFNCASKGISRISASKRGGSRTAALDADE